MPRPSVPGMLAAIVPALLAALLLCGCFDGTVRNPPGEGGMHNGGKHKAHHEDGGQKNGDGGEGSGGGSADVVTLAAVGDTAMGITPTLPPEPATYLDPIKGELKGDVVFGNLEGTLTDVSEDVKCGGAEPGTCFAFRAPPEYAKYFADAGFTVMNLANNHSYDFGEAGQAETIEALRGAGIEPTGLPEEATFVDAAGRKVAFLGFASYDYTNSLTDLEPARALIRAARQQADIVVVAIHAGAEGSDALHVTGEEEIYLGEDRGNPEEFAHMAVEAGADLVLGSGPHVLRGMEIYRHRLIAYSLGNFSGYHNFTLEGVLGESAVLHVTMAADGSFRAGRIASVSLIEAGQPVPDPEERAASLIAELSAEDFGSKGIEVGDEGRIER
ncbi:MAG TPA: CapA family protein [Solirubrobacterales bacterium]|nr:CapA family protein [Solirubrobacterales bacterium]